MSLGTKDRQRCLGRAWAGVEMTVLVASSGVHVGCTAHAQHIYPYNAAVVSFSFLSGIQQMPPPKSKKDLADA
jgi:hypothetical protein